MSKKKFSVSYILPIKELYSTEHYGAVSLVVSEFISSSNHDRHFVFGKKHQLKIIKYGKFVPRKILHIPFIKKTLLYSISCMFYIKTKLYKNNIIEIHNRPKFFKYFNFINNHIIIFFHNDPLKMEGSRTLSERMYLINNTSKIFFNSEYTKKQFLEGLDVSNQLINKCITVYYSFNFTKYNFLYKVKKSKSIIFVGRLVPDKGCLEFLTAFNMIKKECSDWQLIVVGPMTKKNNDYVKKVRVVMDSLEDHMSYFKYQTHEEILKLFAESEIACLPSQWEEPFGRVVMESMAMSCATITSNRGGIPEITGDSALVIEPSVKNLKNAMIKLITDHDFRRELQVKGRQRIQKKFDSETISNKIDRIREDLIR